MMGITRTLPIIYLPKITMCWTPEPNLMGKKMSPNIPLPSDIYEKQLLVCNRLAGLEPHGLFFGFSQAAVYQSGQAFRCYYKHIHQPAHTPEFLISHVS
jgi:hypothetical protein